MESIIIGVNIRSHRERRAWTQERLAGEAKVDVRTIQRAERGEKVSAESLQAIAKAFRLSIDELRRERYKFVELTAIERAVDLRNFFPAGAWEFSADDVRDEAREDAIAAFEADVVDAIEVWADLNPVQRLEVTRSMESRLAELRHLGLVVAAGNEVLRLRTRSQGAGDPLTVNVLYVVISKASEPKLLAMRDMQAPVQFQ